MCWVTYETEKGFNAGLALSDQKVGEQTIKAEASTRDPSAPKPERAPRPPRASSSSSGAAGGAAAGDANASYDDRVIVRKVSRENSEVRSNPAPVSATPPAQSRLKYPPPRPPPTNTLISLFLARARALSPPSLPPAPTRTWPVQKVDAVKAFFGGASVLKIVRDKYIFRIRFDSPAAAAAAVAKDGASLFGTTIGVEFELRKSARKARAIESGAAPAAAAAPRAPAPSTAIVALSLTAGTTPAALSAFFNSCGTIVGTPTTNRAFSLRVERAAAKIFLNPPPPCLAQLMAPRGPSFSTPRRRLPRPCPPRMA